MLPNDKKIGVDQKVSYRFQINLYMLDQIFNQNAFHQRGGDRSQNFLTYLYPKLVDKICDFFFSFLFIMNSDIYLKYYLLVFSKIVSQFVVGYSQWEVWNIPLYVFPTSKPNFFKLS